MSDEQTCKVQAKFGRLSLGESSARLAVKIPRGALSIDKADAMFVQAAVDAELCATAAGNQSDAPGQQVMDAATLRHRISAETGRLGVGKDDYSVGFETTTDNDAAVARLRAFIGKEGSLSVKRIGDRVSKGDEA